MEKKDEEVDRRIDMKTIFDSGQGWTLPAQLGQLKIGQNGNMLFESHLYCLNDLARLWDRLDETRYSMYHFP